MPIYFITGTDTDCGKTYVSVKLLEQAANNGQSTLGLKPIASGCVDDVNEDALNLKQASTIDLPLETINPFRFKDPIAPHIAAEMEGKSITAQSVSDKIKPLMSQADFTIVEGAGGALVPLNETETMVDLIKALDIPVILVVGMKLGCINHALLSHQALIQSGLNIHGWVANCLDKKMVVLNENIETLTKRIGKPLAIF